MLDIFSRIFIPVEFAKICPVRNKMFTVIILHTAYCLSVWQIKDRAIAGSTGPTSRIQLHITYRYSWTNILEPTRRIEAMITQGELHVDMYCPPISLSVLSRSYNM